MQNFVYIHADKLSISLISQDHVSFPQQEMNKGAITTTLENPRTSDKEGLKVASLAGIVCFPST